MYSLSKHQQQCQRSFCDHPLSEVLISFLIEHYYGCDSFFKETMSKKYLLHFLSVYEVKSLGEIYK